MNQVIVSSKFQIVIPKKVRENVKITSGTKLQVIPYKGRIELVPIQPLKNLRGMLTGIDITIKREKDRL